MRGGGKGGEEDGGNGKFAGYFLQGNHSVSIAIWERGLGGYRIHAKITRRIPLSGSIWISGITAQCMTSGEW